MHEVVADDDRNAGLPAQHRREGDGRRIVPQRPDRDQAGALELAISPKGAVTLTDGLAQFDTAIHREVPAGD